MFVDILHSWADDPSVSPTIQAKTRGTLRWIGDLADCALRPTPMLNHQYWFTIADILAVLTEQGQATMWALPETNLPNWQNWMVLEGSSEFGEQLASSYYELTVALLPNRFNGILQNSHFRVSPTPADGLATLAQNIGGLASLLLREYAQDPSDWGTDTSAVYRYLQATPPPPGISGPQVTTRASLGHTHTQDPKTTNDPTSATSSRVTPENTGYQRGPYASIR